MIRQQAVTVDHRRREVHQLAVVRRASASRSIVKARALVDAVALHQDALRALDDRPAAERALELVVLGEPAQDDVDRALPVVDVGIGDVREDTPLGRLLDELRIARVDERDDRAGGLADDAARSS